MRYFVIRILMATKYISPKRNITFTEQSDGIELGSDPLLLHASAAG